MLGIEKRASTDLKGEINSRYDFSLLEHMGENSPYTKIDSLIQLRNICCLLTDNTAYNTVRQV